MTNAESSIPGRYEISENTTGDITILFYGSMDVTGSARLLEQIQADMETRSPSAVTADLKSVVYLDDFGALILIELKRMMSRREGRFRIINPNSTIQNMLSLYDFDAVDSFAGFDRSRTPNLFIRIGGATLSYLSGLKYALFFLGSVCLSLVDVILHPRSLRREETIATMQSAGVDGLPIVALISFLMGLIMAFMSSVQLEQFGANIYVASLVSLAMTRELGPIMTAIIVAGRSGSAFAAEIGTMKISEEVDALFTMGFDPVKFLVIPKLLAALLMVPILTLFSDLFAIIGGLIVGVFMLDLTAGAYIDQTIKTLSLFDVFWGVMKSGVFGIFITWVGCLRGFQVRGGAASVGRATTSAVVSSIFLIIVIDSGFSVILRYWG
ncbi:MAG: MlaE family lipid ABC transporter permease subunit [Deltaproteobacteria bacterium]|nr:MlaE family lipid ABC transporter permease subunit [Deltaproteobacteria bacterium]